MNNTRFATNIHILTLLASQPEVWLSSEYIAGSININPVIVRKELIILANAGLVVTKKGKEGGSKLNKKSSDILISDIYKVVKATEILGKKNMNTNVKCNIGRQINDHLTSLFAEIDERNIQILEKKNLAEFIKQFD